MRPTTVAGRSLVALALAGGLSVALAGGITKSANPAPAHTLASRVAESGSGFTTNTHGAWKFGTHEIVLTGNGGLLDPFDTRVKVTFVPPSGKANAKTVDAFYDGGNTWRARIYVTETGLWTWTSASPDDRLLAGRGGSFVARPSTLPGRLVPHPQNPRAWATESGAWFGQVADTAYKLFHDSDAPLWQAYVLSDAAQGINSVRAGSLGAFDETVATHDTWWHNDPWPGGQSPDTSRFDLVKFQTTDERLAWMLNRVPGMYVQMILFGLKGYGGEGTGQWWATLDPAVRARTMRYMIARWSAFPNVYWLVVNDMNSGSAFPLNLAFAREVGRFFAANEPWRHLMSSGPVRFEGFPFADPADRDWATYAHIEDMDAVGALQIHNLGLDTVPIHIYMAEDRYEQDYAPYLDPGFYFRWLQWSWLLAGGSANYGGRFGVIQPYAETGRTDLHWVGLGGTDYTGVPLHGLDGAPSVESYFSSRGIDLGLFAPDDDLAADLAGQTGQLRPKLARRQHEEVVVYHPNATDHGQAATAQPVAAGVRIDLTAFAGTYDVEWYRARDGASARGTVVVGGAPVDLVAPWTGCDVVVRLTAALRSAPPARGTPAPQGAARSAISTAMGFMRRTVAGSKCRRSTRAGGRAITMIAP